MNTTTSSHQERIQRIPELVQKISLREDALHLEDLKKILMDEWIPSEEFSWITTTRQCYHIFRDIKSIGSYKRKLRPSIAERVIYNINVTRHHGDRLIWDHRNDWAYQALEDIQNAIWCDTWVPYPDATTKEFSKQCVASFINAQKTHFIWREHLPDRTFWEEKRSDITTQQQYNLLLKINQSSQDTKDRILARISIVLLSSFCPRWSWREIGDIIQEESRSKL